MFLLTCDLAEYVGTRKVAERLLEAIESRAHPFLSERPKVTIHCVTNSVCGGFFCKFFFFLM